MKSYTTHTQTSRVTAMVRYLVLTLALPILFVATAFAQNVTFGPGLESTLASMSPVEQTTVIVTFDQEGPLTTTQIAAVEALGITQGITMQSLPIMGVLATPAQVYDLAEMDGVYSIWPNEELTYYNKDAKDLTGVNKLRTDSNLRTSQGLPFSGKGVTVVVNDSGIDATHADLEYGTHVVENVQGLTNLNALSSVLPITYTEGHPNTDTNSGHGTHVAGTVAGTGVRSGGKYEGVAPGADLIGYGSGGVLFILDGLGGFDYALTHQFSFENPIRVITNSWGSSGAPFDPANPISVATYRCFQRGMVITFAAGNDGPDEATHNPYAQAPWVISVGAGEKDGTLASFSSRGVSGQSFTFTTSDGVEWVSENEVSVVAPGVNIISTRALTNGSANGGDADVDAIETAYLPFYTMISGTSMATPHVAGIVALMLEADPTLSPLEVKDILMRTATNMPSREDWEAGTGYANAYNAVVEALGIRTDFGAPLNTERTFNSSADLSVSSTPITIDYNPQPALSADNNQHIFTVPAGLAELAVRINANGVLGETGNTIYPAVIAPDGTEYASGTTLLFPLDFNRVEIISSPMAGEWTVEIRGIQNGTGNNVVSLPQTVNGEIAFTQVNGFTGLNDIEGHPASGAIQNAVNNHLLDGYADGTFRPDALLTRAELAEYLVMGAGVRQSLPLNGGFSFGDVSSAQAPFVEAATANGAALKDIEQRFDGLIRTSGGTFNPDGTISRAELAYSMIQSLGLQAAAEDMNADFAAGQDMTVDFQGERIVIDDQDDIPADLKGYVQLALELSISNAYFSLEQGPFDLVPTIHATFSPDDAVTRGGYAVAATVTFQRYVSGVTLVEDPDARMAESGSSMDAETLEAEVPTGVELGSNYPNPFNPSTQIQFTLPADGPVRLAVYNLLGQRVRLLVDSANLGAGTHQVTFEASDLASGTYLYRLETPQQTISRRMVLMK